MDEIDIDTIDVLSVVLSVWVVHWFEVGVGSEWMQEKTERRYTKLRNSARNTKCSSDTAKKNWAIYYLIFY